MQNCISVFKDWILKYEQMKRRVADVRGVMYSHIKLSKHVTEEKVQLAPRKTAITMLAR